MQRWMKTRRKATGAMNAVEFLRDDNQQTRHFFRTIAKMDASDQQQDRLDLIKHVCTELMIHMRIEEMIFYPALRASLNDDALINAALVEHDCMRELLHELRHTDQAPEMDAKLHLLAKQIDRHVAEKEARLFPAALQLPLNLAAMGRMLAAASQQLRTNAGPTPGGRN